tara:strand:- start:1055 stop:1834 length:780 start_codon:yes stop_codon:yes gene_type:complete
MYFSQLPDVFIGEGLDDTESFKYRLVKNIFRRVKIRSDIADVATSFESYILGDDETPELIAQALWQNGHYDWVILLGNNITDFYEQWPKNSNDLTDYCREKYNDIEAIHHYETNEIKYNDDIVMYKEGLQVNESFRAVVDGTTLTAEQSRNPISNYEWEYYLNEKKRMIRIPTTLMFDVMNSEFENLIAYEPHSELDEFGNKKTPLNVAQRFLDVSGYVTGSISKSDEIGTVTSYDYGPSATTSTAGVATTVASQTVTV